MSRYAIDFNMDSDSRGVRTIDVTTSKGTHKAGGSVTQALPRDTSQRFAREITELEYKLLEEKTRAQDRERELKEEIMLERGRVPHMVNEKVNQILKEREREMREEILASIDTSRNVEGTAEVIALRAELDRVNQQLKKHQQLQIDTEKKHQDEKIELLNMRSEELKSVTTNKHHEGDVIGRAMQVMSEYEGVIRSSEESSLSRLAHHMESFEKEWLRRTHEFEKQKGNFEAQVMEKALSVLQSHGEDIAAVGKRIADKTINLLKNQSNTRLKLEEEVLEHSEAFKKQYKDILEHEFRERCRVYDEKFAEREGNLVDIIQCERENIIAAERKAVEKHEDAYMGAMAEAMREISELRQQLLKEHQENQARGIEKLLSRRDEMSKDQEKIISEVNLRVEKIEKECYEAVDVAQKALVEMQGKMASRESEMAEKLLTIDMEREKARIAGLAALREEVDKHWKDIVDEINQRHSNELANQLKELQTRIDNIHSQQIEREQELRHNYETKLVAMEEAADERWSRRLKETSKSLDRHLEVIQALRDDNDGLLSQLTSMQEKYTLREKEMSTKASAVLRDYEEVWHKKMEDMRIRYDKLLQEALSGPSGDVVSRVEHDSILEMLHAAEARLVDMRNSERERIGIELNQLNDMWRGRLDEERADRIVWEQDQLQKLAELRVEIQADTRKRETEALRRMEQEKFDIYETRNKKFLDDIRTNDAFEEKIRAEYDAKQHELEEELHNSYVTKCIKLEERMKEKEDYIEKERQEMRTEMRNFEEKTRANASEWLEREKAEIMTDVRYLHEKVTDEKRKLQENNILFEKDTQQRYAEMFEECRDKLREQMLAMSASHIEHWKQCEDSWLTFREQELEMIFTTKAEYEANIIETERNARDAAISVTNKLLETEREMMMKMEVKLQTEMQNVRIEAENAAMERAMKLIEERNASLAEWERQRAQHEVETWEKIESHVLKKEHDAEDQRRAMELELREKYDLLIAEEKKRADALLEDRLNEQRIINNNVEKIMREKDEQWQKKRLEQEAADSVSREQQYIQLTKQADERVKIERDRQEKIMREMEENFEKERARMLDAVEKQYKNNESTHLQKTAEMRQEYETNIRNLTLELNHQRERFISDIANQQSKHLIEKDLFETESLKKFEKTLEDLRNLLEKREREHQAREMELRTSMENSKREYEDRVNKQYEKLVAEHQENLQKMQKDFEVRAMEHEKDHQRSLVALRKAMETNLSKLMEESDKKSDSLTEETREHFHAKLHDQIELLKEERDKRIEAENRVQELLMDIDILKSGNEQQKLDIYQTINKKFEKRFSELQEKLRDEKEHLAKSLLEEEEKKAARELSRSDNSNFPRVPSYDTVDDGYVPISILTSSSSMPVSRTLTQSSHTHDVGPSSGNTCNTSGNTTTRRGVSCERQQSLHQTPTSTDAHNRNVSSNIGNTTGTTTGAQHSHLSQHTPSSYSPTTTVTVSPQRTVTESTTVSLQIKKKKERLYQLWELMDYPDEDRQSALNRYTGHISQEDTLTSLTEEVRRFEAMLPILELITRKEFIQHRVVELSRQQGKQYQIADFVEEMYKLGNQLIVDIKRFEEKHKIPFVYRGNNYLEVIMREAQVQRQEGMVTPPTPMTSQHTQKRR